MRRMRSDLSLPRGRSPGQPSRQPDGTVTVAPSGPARRRPTRSDTSPWRTIAGVADDDVVRRGGRRRLGGGAALERGDAEHGGRNRDGRADRQERDALGRRRRDGGVGERIGRCEAWRLVLLLGVSGPETKTTGTQVAGAGFAWLPASLSDQLRPADRRLPERSLGCLASAPFLSQVGGGAWSFNHGLCPMSTPWSSVTKRPLRVRERAPRARA